MTRLITSAAKLSPFLTSCGFSSEYSSNDGSTMLNAGSVPFAASSQNASMPRTCSTCRAMPIGYRSAVKTMSLPMSVTFLK